MYYVRTHFLLYFLLHCLHYALSPDLDCVLSYCRIMSCFTAVFYPFSLSVLCPASLPVLWLVTVCIMSCLITCTASMPALSCLICVCPVSWSCLRDACLCPFSWSQLKDALSCMSVCVLTQGYTWTVFCFACVLSRGHIWNGVLSCLCHVSRTCMGAEQCPSYGSYLSNLICDLSQGHAWKVLSCLYHVSRKI